MTVRENEVKVVVGNTLRRIPQSEAKLDRTGKFCKVNEWVLYVDVVEGNPDVRVLRGDGRRTALNCVRCSVAGLSWIGTLTRWLRFL